jgi:type II secretory pathway component PulC
MCAEPKIWTKEMTQMNIKLHSKRIGILLGLAAGLALAAAPAVAGSPAPGEDGDATNQAQLEDAQARLEAAAREIAELTAEIVGDAGATAIARIEELARRPRPVMLGVTVGPVGGPEAREDGVQVMAVTPASSADEAGIRSGDVLMSLGERQLDWSDDTSPVSKLLEALRELEPGTQFPLTYRRDGRVATADVEARAGSWAQAFAFDTERLRHALPPGAPEAMRRLMLDRWGDMELVALSPALGEYFKADEGVLVVRAPSDPALGLRDGDVIVDIAGRKPADPGHVVRILRSYAPGERLVMTVVRRGEPLQLEADIPANADRG